MSDKNISVITRRDFVRRAACAAVGTFAMTSAIRDLRFMNAAVAQSNISDYKALVCIFLQGGNDSNNLVVPTVPSEYSNYNMIRTPVLALPLGSLQTLDGYTDPAGHTFGLHPACPELKTLFGEGKLAFLINTGTLVYPITRAQYLAGSTAKPPQLFSHADQQTQWQTSIPDQPALTGWGGRCADLLNSVNPNSLISLSVSLAGANTFEVGNIVSQYSVSTSGAISLSGVSGARLAALTNILGLPYPNMQAQAYAGVAAHSINTGALLNNAITNTASANFWTNNVGGTGFPTTITTPNGGSTFTSSLSSQLKMVARLIEAGNRAAGNPTNGFGMRRQIFFCQVGGYDLHSGQTNYSTNIPNNVHPRRAREFVRRIEPVVARLPARDGAARLAKQRHRLHRERFWPHVSEQRPGQRPRLGQPSSHPRRRGRGQRRLGHRRENLRHVSHAHHQRPGRHRHRPLDSDDRD